jgi:hypothetical protein
MLGTVTGHAGKLLVRLRELGDARGRGTQVEIEIGLACSTTACCAWTFGATSRCLPVVGGGTRIALEARAVPALAKLLAIEGVELAEAAAHALGATDDASAEEPLLRALADGAPAVSLAAATALGRVGSRTAVVPLREAEKRGGPLSA